MSVPMRALAPLWLGTVLCVAGCDVDEASALAGEAGASETSDDTGGGSAGGSAEGDGDPAGTTGEGSDTSEEDLGCDTPSPYAGGWDIGCCQDEVIASPWLPGEIAPGLVIPDWTFTDQFGEPVRVYDFCHEAIYFEYIAMWCSACQAHAPVVASLFDTYDARGLMTLTFMSESDNGNAVSLADVQAWSANYGQDGLVVFSDAYDDVWYPFALDSAGGSYSFALPGTMFVAPGMKIAKLGVPTIQDIELAIPN